MSEKDIEETNSFNKLSAFIDNNLRGIRLGITVCMGIGLIFIARSARMLKIFTSASEIPETFVNKNIKLRGIVKNIDESGILMVQHVPVYRPSFIGLRDNNFLNVKLLGVELHENGYSWMKSHLLDKHIWFQLFSIDNKRILQCMVFNGENFIIRSRTNINELLIKNGLATATTIKQIKNKRKANKVVQKFIKAEMQAQNQERGLWVNSSPGIMDKLSSIKNRFRDWRNHVKKSFISSQSRMLEYFRRKD